MSNSTLMPPFYLAYRDRLPISKTTSATSGRSLAPPISQTVSAISDRFVRLAEERPTVGIILCEQNHFAHCEITLPEGANVHAREHELVLPSKAYRRLKLPEWTAEHPR